MGGTAELYKKYGKDYSYTECPRAKIFARGHSV